MQAYMIIPGIRVHYTNEQGRQKPGNVLTAVRPRLINLNKTSTRRPKWLFLVLDLTTEFIRVGHSLAMC